MAETKRVWVRTSVLDEIVHGKLLTTNKRAIPDPSNPSSGANQNWGWARGTVVNDSKSSDDVTVFLEDEDSSHNRSTVVVPMDKAKDGLVSANVYGSGCDSDDDDDDELYNDEGECKYPDDLITLTHLHEPAVVYSIRKRYGLDKIYTATGPILLALNPFKNCGPIYSDEVMAQYRRAGEQSMTEDGDVDKEWLPPHVFKMADNSFRIMMARLSERNAGGGGGGNRRGGGAAAKKEEGGAGGIDQSILVSGESGAGKTVTTKFIMKYLAQLSKSNDSLKQMTKEDEKQSIEKQVLNSNPILESFGNARTIRNDNSSRFGKFIEIQFTNTGSLAGASVDTYLLEKVRLVHQMPGERNYHIFYELLAGFTDEQLEKYHINDFTADDFKMVNMSGTFDRRDGVEDHETFTDLSDAMNVMNFTKEEMDNIFKVTVCCLHAMNLDILAVTADVSKIDEDNEHLEAVLALMGVDYESLNAALCSFSIKAGREMHVRSLPKAKAEKGIQGLVKAFYGALFTFLVHRVNQSITVKKDDDGANKGGKSRRRSVSGGKAASIGVLDIFGFESFKVNSFEQLCINYCNEALQQQFNMFVLKNEQDEYEKEGIKWAFIAFPENQDVLDLIGKRNTGIISILDGQCRAPGTSDKTFANDLYKNCTKHSRFEANFRQVGALKFGLVHYAGPVEYDIAGFLEKNKDELPKEASDLLAKSTNSLCRTIGSILQNPSSPIGGGPPKKEPEKKAPVRGKAPKRATVGGQFSAQLTELRQKIDLTSPHYVRCLKPNDQLIPDFYNPVIIADQLRCAGVVEAVRVSRVGYPQRYPHSKFVNRYNVLALQELKTAARINKKNKPVTVLVNVLATRILQDEAVADGKTKEAASGPPDLIAAGIQVGKTKVFLRRKAFDILEKFRSTKMMEGAIRIQALVRKFIGYRFYQLTLKSVVRIQSKARSNICKAIVEVMRRNFNATVLQAKWRMTYQRIQYAHKKIAVRWVARMQRGRMGRVRYIALNRIRKSIVIQKYWRRYVLYMAHKLHKKSAWIMQCAVRSYFARKVLEGLKEAARNLAAMSGERDQLRQENSALRNKLEMAEVRMKAALETAANAGASKEVVKEIENEKNRLKEESDRLLSDLEEVHTKLKEETQRADEAETSTKEKTDEYEILRKEAVDLREKVGELLEASTQASQKAGEEMKEMRVETDQLRTELQDFKKEADSQAAEAKAAEASLIEEVEQMKVEIEEVQAEKDDAIAMAAAETEASQEQIEATLAEVEEAHSDEVDTLRAEADQLRTERDEAQTALENIPEPEPSVPLEELEDAKAEIEALKKQLDEAIQKGQDDYDVTVREAAEAEEETKKEALERITLAEQAKQQAVEKADAAKTSEREALGKLAAAEKAAEMALQRVTAAEKSKEQALEKISAAEEAKQHALEKIASAEETTKQALERVAVAEEAEQAALKKAASAEADANANAAAVFSMSAAPQVAERAPFPTRPKSTPRTPAADGNDGILSDASFRQPPQADRPVVTQTVKVEVPSVDMTSAEIISLKKYVQKLEKELAQAKSAPQAAANPMDANFMMKQYEELKKFTDAMMEKDREISNLRHEIQVLRERGSTEADSFDSSHFSFTNFPGTRSNKREMVTEVVNEQDEALQAVNQLLRRELEEARAEVKTVTAQLKEEKIRSQEDLKAFSHALRGVDELRQSAEIMSRELARVKQKNRRTRNRERGFAANQDFDDDVTIATVATATLDEASRVLNSHQKQQVENPFWAKLRNFKDTLLEKVVEDDRSY